MVPPWSNVRSSLTDCPFEHADTRHQFVAVDITTLQMTLARRRIELRAGMQYTAVVKYPHVPCAQPLLDAKRRISRECDEPSIGAVQCGHFVHRRVERTAQEICHT